MDAFPDHEVQSSTAIWHVTHKVEYTVHCVVCTTLSDLVGTGQQHLLVPEPGPASIADH
jgi:hypothetical protein